MANKNAPFGLRPVRYMNGAPWTGAATKYAVASDYATALYIGTVVDLVGTTEATGKFPTVQIATLADGNYTIGPIVAVEPNPATSLNRVYLPASTGGYVWVADDPNLIFHVQVDSTTAIGIADFGLNAILVATSAGSTTTGLCGHELDEDSCTADASNMLLVHRLADIEDNELAAHAIVEVSINMHRYRATGDGDGSLGA